LPPAESPPAARSGKGGRRAAEPLPEELAPVAAPRSGKGGQAQAPAPAPEVEAKVAIGELRDRMREGRKAIDGSLAPEFEAAAKRVVKLKAFKDAQLIRVHLNPRTYQVRLAALRAGKKLLVVRKEMYDLLLVDPAKIPARELEQAATPPVSRSSGRRWT